MAFIQKKGATGTDSINAAWDTQPTEGNFLVAVLKGQGLVTDVTFSGWTYAGKTEWRSNPREMGIWYKQAGASEGNIQASWLGDTAMMLWAAEFSNLPNAVLDRIANVDSDGSSVTSRSAGTTGVTTADNEVAISAVGTDNVITGMSWSNSFILSHGVFQYLEAGYKILSSTGAQETTLSWTNSVQAGGIIATFKSGSAESASESASPSASPSHSESASPSHTPSASPSSSESGSPSSSPSHSESASISPSSSESASPSAGYQGYSRGSESDFPAGTNDLAHIYTEQELIDVADQDETYVSQDATNDFVMHQFKEFVGDNPAIKVTCVAKAGFAPHLSRVALKAYNINTEIWDELDADDSSNSDAPFTLSGIINNLTNYKDAQKVVTFRVYQDIGI